MWQGGDRSNVRAKLGLQGCVERARELGDRGACGLGRSIRALHNAYHEISAKGLPVPCKRVSCLCLRLKSIEIAQWLSQVKGLYEESMKELTGCASNCTAPEAFCGAQLRQYPETS